MTTTVYVIISGGVCQDVIVPEDAPDIDYEVIDFDEFDSGPLDGSPLEYAYARLRQLERDLPEHEITSEWRSALAKNEQYDLDR